MLVNSENEFLFQKHSPFIFPYHRERSGVHLGKVACQSQLCDLYAKLFYLRSSGLVLQNSCLAKVIFLNKIQLYQLISEIILTAVKGAYMMLNTNAHHLFQIFYLYFLKYVLLFVFKNMHQFVIICHIKSR